VRPVEQQRHFAGHRAWFGEHGDDRVASDDFKPSFEQHEQPSGLGALVQNHAAGRHPPLNSTRAIVENFAHP
jgi:hypothetical protein